MQHRPATSVGRPATRRPSARAFTLPELVVAVGAAAILTASVGMLFRSVGDLSSSGVAATQLDAAARVLERQLREDFAAMGKLSAEQTFFAIRFREVGDIDRDGNVSPNFGERSIYLTEADREHDVDLEVAPYTVDSDLRPVSRAVTTRLDEMIFLAEGQFVSGQAWGTARAPHARLYWGHGLKPLPDPDFVGELDTLTNLPIPPRRMSIPDGDFGTRAGDLFDFHAHAAVIATGRNEYATGWTLARHAALLHGPITYLSTLTDPTGQLAGDIWFAPYIRDQELFDRRLDWRVAYPYLGNPGDALEGDLPGVAEPRFLQSGRTDVIAQTLEDVRRWLEGEPERATTNDAIQSGRPFSAGAFEDPAATITPNVDGDPRAWPLWVRYRQEAHNPPYALPPDPTVPIAVENALLTQSAIAGVFLRPLVEDTASPVVSRQYDPTITGADFRERAAADIMDTHSVIATRCSRFEIAWTDGSFAAAPIDVDGDNVPDYESGDPIWFDISPIVSANGAVLRRNTYSDWLLSSDGASVRFADAQADVRGREATLFPEIINDPVFSAFGATVRQLDPVLYNPQITGASLVNNGQGPEAYAIWGFRDPRDDQRAWPKPTRIRVRVTLHDRELRSSEGKTYEFIFPITLRAD